MTKCPRNDSGSATAELQGPPRPSSPVRLSERTENITLSDFQRLVSLSIKPTSGWNLALADSDPAITPAKSANARPTRLPDDAAAWRCIVVTIQSGRTQRQGKAGYRWNRAAAERTVTAREQGIKPA